MKLNKNKNWIYAKNIIPGGNMLISKRSDFLLPDYWPSYYKKAKGCFVWDLNNNKLLDMYFGVGTNIHGYTNNKIDKRIHEVIKNSNMSSLNSYDEVLLAKELIKIHKWPSMAKFSRSGGEANAIAIRIARASSKNKNIAFCGYHGWHDWYLSSTLNKNNSLSNHLIPGIDSSGIPHQLKNTAFPFQYNNFEMLKKIVKEKKIGIIKMEVQRNYYPKNNFLQKVRRLATKNKIILIFDECTTGFRENLGGLHLKYKVYPDMLILGKALGNGYAINAVLGKRNIMQAANKTFISSTFWTERIGYAAALACLKEMKKKSFFKKIIKTGKYIKKGWSELAKKNKIKIEITGIDPIPIFNFENKINIEASTYLTQEMLKKNIIATNCIYVSIAHTKKYIDLYLRELDKIFFKISKNKHNLKKFIKGPLKQRSLKRVN